MILFLVKIIFIMGTIHQFGAATEDAESISTTKNTSAPTMDQIISQLQTSGKSRRSRSSSINTDNPSSSPKSSPSVKVFVSPNLKHASPAHSRLSSITENSLGVATKELEEPEKSPTATMSDVISQLNTPPSGNRSRSSSIGTATPPLQNTLSPTAKRVIVSPAQPTPHKTTPTHSRTPSASSTASLTSLATILPISQAPSPSKTPSEPTTDNNRNPPPPFKTEDLLSRLSSAFKTPHNTPKSTPSSTPKSSQPPTPTTRSRSNSTSSPKPETKVEFFGKLPQGLNRTVLEKFPLMEKANKDSVQYQFYQLVKNRVIDGAQKSKQNKSQKSHNSNKQTIKAGEALNDFWGTNITNFLDLSDSDVTSSTMEDAPDSFSYLISSIRFLRSLSEDNSQDFWDLQGIIYSLDPECACKAAEQYHNSKFYCLANFTLMSIKSKISPDSLEWYPDLSKQMCLAASALYKTPSLYEQRDSQLELAESYLKQAQENHDMSLYMNALLSFGKVGNIDFTKFDQLKLLPCLGSAERESTNNVVSAEQRKEYAKIAGDGYLYLCQQSSTDLQMGYLQKSLNNYVKAGFIIKVTRILSDAKYTDILTRIPWVQENKEILKDEPQKTQLRKTQFSIYTQQILTYMTQDWKEDQVDEATLFFGSYLWKILKDSTPEKFRKLRFSIQSFTTHSHDIWTFDEDDLIRKVRLILEGYE